VWLGAATFALYTGTEVGVALWTFTLLTEGRGLSTAVAGTCVSAYWGALFVGRVLYGIVAERLPGRQASMACIGGMAVGAVVIALPGPAYVTVIGVMMIGAFAAPVFPLLTLTTAERVGAEHAAPAVGLQIGAASVGAVVFPVRSACWWAATAPTCWPRRSWCWPSSCSCPTCSPSASPRAAAGCESVPAMGLEVRTITDDEVPAFCAAMNTGFLNPSGTSTPTRAGPA
jgi:MFS family permease